MQQSTCLLIETNLGNCIRGSNTDVFARINGHYVGKQAHDINQGETIDYKAQWKGVDFETQFDPKLMQDYLEKRVDPELMQDVREYRYAKREIHQENANGQYVPILRILLLRGIFKGQLDSGLEKRILLEDGTDIDAEDYELAVSEILPLVNVTRSAVTDWVKGETIAPETWRNFQSLAQLNPEFQMIFDSHKRDYGFHIQYKFYVEARQVAMRCLSKPKGGGTGKQKKRPSNGRRGKFAKLIELVISSPLAIVREGHFPAVVRRIREIPVGEEPRHVAQESHKHLYRGISTEPPKNLRPRTMGEVYEQQQVLDEALKNLINRYFEQKYHLEKMSGPAEYMSSKVYYDGIVRPRVYTRLIRISPAEKRALEINRVSDIAEAEGIHSEKDLNAEVEEFSSDLRSGRIDDMFGLPRHTVMELIYQTNVLRAALPRSYHEMTRVLLDLNYLRQYLQVQEGVIRDISQNEHILCSKMVTTLTDLGYHKMNLRGLEKLIRDLTQRGNRNMARRERRATAPYLERGIKITKRDIRDLQEKEIGLAEQLSRNYEFVPEACRNLFMAEFTELCNNDNSLDPFSVPLMRRVKQQGTGRGRRYFTRQEVEDILQELHLEPVMAFIEEENFV